MSESTTAMPAAGPGRPTLAARQSELVAALVTAAMPPAGFTAERLAVTRRALLTKRAGEVGSTWPGLAAAFGDRWPAQFHSWAGNRPPQGALRDGWDLARELAKADRLPALARTELLVREVTMCYRNGDPPRRRRTPTVRRLGRTVALGWLGRVCLIGP